MKHAAPTASREKTGVAATAPRREAEPAAAFGGAARGVPAFLQRALYGGGPAAATSGVSSSAGAGASTHSAASPASLGGGTVSVGAPNSHFEHEAESFASSIDTPGSNASAPRLSSANTSGGASSGASLGSSTGNPLRTDQQQFFGDRLGQNLGHVRIHTGAESHQFNEALSARAFTHGSEVYFRQGEYQPDSAQGRSLLAHELVHVVQQGGAGGALIQRAPAPGFTIPSPAEDASGPETAQLLLAAAFQKLLLTIAAAPALTPKANFERELEQSALPQIGFASEADKASIKANAAEVAKLEESHPTKSAKISIPDAFFQLAQSRKTGSTTVSLLAFSMARHLAELFRSELDGFATDIPGSPVSAKELAMNAVWLDLGRAKSALTDERMAVQLELEGTLALLIDRRREFIGSKDPSFRKTVGQQIGELSRSALLLNELHGRMDQSADPTQMLPSQLDEALRQRSVEIDGLARTAQNEGATMKAFGDNLSLQTEQAVAVENAEFPELLQRTSTHPTETYGAKILPEQAFPVTVDYSENQMLRSLEERVTSQQNELGRMRNAIIPASPTYSLPEFAQVFQRWASFFSVEQENQDPMIKMNMELLGPTYQMFGSSALGAHPNKMYSKLLEVEGAIARHMLMSLVTGQMDKIYPVVPSMKPDLGSRTIGPHKRSENTSGPAYEPTYEFGELFAGSKGGASLGGEMINRQQRSETNREQSAKDFTTAFDAQPKSDTDQLLINLGLKDNGDAELQKLIDAHLGTAPTGSGNTSGNPVLPITGLRTVEAKEGWSMLVDVWDPQTVFTTNPQRLGFEHKVVPPEIIDYLLAAELHRATLAKPHQPTYGGKVIGDAAVRGKGLEFTDAINTAMFFNGEVNPKPSDEATALKGSLSTATSQLNSWNIGSFDKPVDPTRALIVSLESYFAEYFKRPELKEAPYRIATVMVIAAVQFDAGKKLDAIIDPMRIGQTLGVAVIIDAMIRGISSRGRLGKLAGRGIAAALSVNGVNDIAAIQGMLSFMMLAADATDLHTARVRARLVGNFLNDAQELFDSMLSKAATSGIHELASRFKNPPDTPRQMVDAFGPSLKDPATRAALLNGAEAELKAMEAHPDFNRLQPSDEYRAMAAFRDQLQARATGVPTRPSIDADMHLRRDRAEEDAMGKILSRRTDADRLALHEALGPHKDVVPLIENPTLGNGVKVHYDDGKLRVEVGPKATPDRVRAHQETIKQLRRYEGPIGKLRRVRDGFLEAIGLREKFGSLKHEAQLEVDKLRTILADLDKRQLAINERAQRLSSDEKLAASRAEQAEITRDIDGLQRQLAHYETVLKTASSSAPGRGFVASGDTTGKALEAQLRTAEKATRTQDTVAGEARKTLVTRQDAQRNAAIAAQKATDELAKAREYETHFGKDPDPTSAKYARDMRAKAEAELKQAEAELAKSKAEVDQQKKAINAAEQKLYKLRDAEVDIAKQELESRIKDLSNDRRTALADRRAAEADVSRTESQLRDAQNELDTALKQERARTVPDSTKDGADQVKAFYQAREDRLKPLRDDVKRLTEAQTVARKNVTDATARHAKATEEINKRVAEFEYRQAAAAGITAAHYDYLRTRTPNQAARDIAKKATEDAIYKTPLKNPEADHIVPMYEIVRMPGFNRLTPDQQVKILNDPQNFWTLEKSVNASKQHYTLREWRGHPDTATFKKVSDADYDKLIAQEDGARDYLLKEIAKLAPP